MDGVKRTDAAPAGMYLYCVAEGGGGMNFGPIGIGNEEVYAMKHRDLLAVVQDFEEGRLSVRDEGVLKDWMIVHQNVVDRIMETVGAVLPLGFGNVVTARAGLSPEGEIIRWLERDYGNLKEKFKRIKGKMEYGVEVLWDPKVVAERLIRSVPEIKGLDEKVRSSSLTEGTAFLHGEKLKKELKREMEVWADRYFRDFYSLIRDLADDVKIDGIKKTVEGKRMLMNLSCLIGEDKVKTLGRLLEDIEKEGFTVRFTGPWPPYSFV